MYYNQINGIRFIAVIFVIFHHTIGNEIEKIFNFGFFGVNLFFVLSGFLISEKLILEKLKGTSDKVIIKNFFFRRLLRIFPLYFLYLIICYIIVPNEFSHYTFWLITFSTNFWITLNNELTFWYLTHLWSIALEEQFYLFWPFIIIFIPIRKLIYFFLVVICFAVIFRWYSTLHFNNFKLYNYTMLHTNLDSLGIGALLAYFKQFNIKLLYKILNNKTFFLLILIILLLNYKLDNLLSKEIFNKLLVAILSFYIIGKASLNIFSSFLKKFLQNKIIEYLGKISFGIYIYHILVWGEFGPKIISIWNTIMNDDTNSLTRKLIVFTSVSLFTFLIASFSFEFFEKKFLVYKNKFTVNNN